MQDFRAANLCHDAVHGYISFISGVGLGADEVAERQIIDHPWLQRLRQIHQLQTAWWVFPTAEHTRFQHVLGVMHLASRAVQHLYESLREVCPDVPSRGYVESLARMAGLLHDVGHGPFGHFLDEHFLSKFGLTHETLGCRIITAELGPLLARIRRNPYSQLEDHETLDPAQIAMLITRPSGHADEGPRWLQLLRSLFCGIYTVDNMDFVLRDAYMSGYSAKSFDLERLLHYSFFSKSGLTIHSRGLSALISFMETRANLFRSIYYHRTVRAIDLTLADLFKQSHPFLFPGNPLEHLAEYQRFTEWSLLVEVAKWDQSGNPTQRELAPAWQRLLARDVPWKMICQRFLAFDGADERASIFSHADVVERELRGHLPKGLKEMALKVDLARHTHRPHTLGPSDGQNFLFDEARGEIRPLSTDQLFRRLPTSHRICRVYAPTEDHTAEIATALDSLLGPGSADDLTNM